VDARDRLSSAGSGALRLEGVQSFVEPFSSTSWLCSLRGAGWVLGKRCKRDVVAVRRKEMIRMGLETPETERIDIPKPEPLDVPKLKPSEEPAREPAHVESSAEATC
jgi:hypothetical protein